MLLIIKSTRDYKNKSPSDNQTTNPQKTPMQDLLSFHPEPVFLVLCHLFVTVNFPHNQLASRSRDFTLSPYLQPWSHFPDLANKIDLNPPFYFYFPLVRPAPRPCSFSFLTGELSRAAKFTGVVCERGWNFEERIRELCELFSRPSLSHFALAERRRLYKQNPF